MISSSPTSLITMHNVRRFLQDAVFEPSQDARARAAAEGNARPEDMIPIYRKRTTIDSAGRESEVQTRCALSPSLPSPPPPSLLAVGGELETDRERAGTSSSTAQRRSPSSARTRGTASCAS